MSIVFICSSPHIAFCRFFSIIIVFLANHVRFLKYFRDSHFVYLIVTISSTYLLSLLIILLSLLQNSRRSLPRDGGKDSQWGNVHRRGKERKTLLTEVINQWWLLALPVMLPLSSLLHLKGIVAISVIAPSFILRKTGSSVCFPLMW